MDGTIALAGMVLGITVVAFRALSRAVGLDKQVVALRAELDELRAELNLPPVDRGRRDQKV